jgi:hypothetical protein
MTGDGYEDEHSSGPLWNGQPGFSFVRWDFWQRRFFELSGEVNLTAGHREVVRKKFHALSTL